MFPALEHSGHDRFGGLLGRGSGHATRLPDLYAGAREEVRSLVPGFTPVGYVRSRYATAILEWIEAWYNPTDGTPPSATTPMEFEDLHNAGHRRGMIITPVMSGKPGQAPTHVL